MIKKIFSGNMVGMIIIVLAIILVPFFLFHEQIDAWTAENIKSNEQPFKTAALIAASLCFDILLPIPSSIVMTGAGYFLGFFTGSLVSFIGITAGCLLGYWLGKSADKIHKWINARSMQQMEQFFKRYGKWAIIIARPIPVLAEATVFFAGFSKMKPASFLLSILASNLGLSVMYAAIGAYSFSANSMLWAFLGAVIVPGIALLLEKLYRKKVKSNYTIP